MINIIFYKKKNIINNIFINKVSILVIYGILIWLNIIHITILLIKNIFYILLNNLEYLVIIFIMYMYLYIKYMWTLDSFWFFFFFGPT